MQFAIYYFHITTDNQIRAHVVHKGRKEKCIQGFSGKTCRKQTSWEILCFVDHASLYYYYYYYYYYYLAGCTFPHLPAPVWQL